MVIAYALIRLQQVFAAKVGLKSYNRSRSLQRFWISRNYPDTLPHSRSLKLYPGPGQLNIPLLQEHAIARPDFFILLNETKPKIAYDSSHAKPTHSLLKPTFEKLATSTSPCQVANSWLCNSMEAFAEMRCRSKAAEDLPDNRLRLRPHTTLMEDKQNKVSSGCFEATVRHTRG